MYCPFCCEPDTKVIDSRLVGEGNQVRRRRACDRCAERFTTYEFAELTTPQIIKRDGRRSPFDEQKLRNGILRALEKRPVGAEQIETLMTRLLRKLRASGEREVSSQVLGAWVMEELRQLDKVAYIRFASVYWSFQDIQAFKKAIDSLL